MIFYKILADGKVLDVNDVFLRWQPRHGIMIVCDPAKAEFICPRDCSGYYHPTWLNTPPEGAVYDGEIEAEEITEAQYRELLEALDGGWEVDNPEPDPGGEVQNPEDNNTSDNGWPTKPAVADIKQLVDTCADLKTQVQMLTDCLLEMSEEVYG